MAFVAVPAVFGQRPSRVHGQVRRAPICARQTTPDSSEDKARTASPSRITNLEGLTKPATTPVTTPAPAPEVPKPKKLSNPEVILERFSDTALDVRIHYSRYFRRQKPSQKAEDLPRLVVLGTGWGAHSLVKILDLDCVSSVKVISPRNYFFFTPLLSSTAVGTTEFRSIVEPIRRANQFVDYFEAFATDVDFENKIVRCKGGQREGYPSADNEEFEIPYDILVVAVGESTTTFGVSGARKHAFFLKEIPDARRLRTKLLDSLEKASLPIWTEEQRRKMLHFVVVGGGPTGCEFAGELADFINSDLTSKYDDDVVSAVRVTLLQSGDALLTQFEESLQKVALDNFKDRVQIEFNSRVVRVEESFLELRDGRIIDYGVLVWAAGNSTRPITARIISRLTGMPVEEAIKKRGKIVVDPWLRVVGAKNVFALGDCAMLDDEPLPSTAQVAGQQGAYIGRLLSKSKNYDKPAAPVLRGAEDRELNPFRFLSLGAMAYLGNDNAIVQVDTTKNKTLRLGGNIAFLLWRSVYAVKQVDVRNRVLVLFDWFKTRAFGRDVSQF